MVKYTVILFFALMLTIYSYSQDTTNRYQELIQKEFFNPRDKLKKFRGLLVDQRDSCKKIINIDTITTRAIYKFLPAIDDSLEFGNVKFNIICIMNNKDRIVENVSLSKAYLKKDGYTSEDYMIKEYIKLTAFLDEKLKVQATPFQEKGTQGIIQNKMRTMVRHPAQGLSWVKGNVTYRISLSIPTKADSTSNLLGAINVIAWRAD